VHTSAVSAPPPPSNPWMSACPSCKSPDIIQTHEQLGEYLFFCPACEHSWSVRAGTLPKKSAQRT
jgi:transposase-like protein